MPAGTTLTLSIAFFSVPVTSGFAPLLNPMWQSLICTKEKSSTFPARRRTTLHRLRQQLRSRHTANHRPQQARSGPRHAPQKIAPVDAVACSLRSVLALLHYFVFLKPIHINLHLAFDCLHCTKLASSAFIPTLQQIIRGIISLRFGLR